MCRPQTALLLALLLAPLHCLAAAVDIEVIDTHPAVGELASGEGLYLHIRYQSDEPLRFQARAAGVGFENAGVMMNPAPAYPAGEGEAITWVAFRHAFVPEEISVVAFSHGWTERSVVQVTPSVRWTGQPALQAAPRPDWVIRLSDEQQALTSQRLEAPDDRKSTIDWLIFIMAWSVPGYFLLQGWVWLRWHDGWRKAGLLPLWAGVPATGHAVFALLMGSNLWPIVMLFVLPVLTVYLVVIATIRLLKA